MDMLINGLTDLFMIVFNVLIIPVAIGLVWWVILLIHRHKTKDQKEYDYEKWRIERYYDELNSLLTSIGNEMIKLARLLRSINSSLDKAKVELDRGAASLFWQEIEQASRDLRDVTGKQDQVSRLNSEYLDKANDLFNRFKLGHPGVPYSGEIRDSIVVVKNLGQRLSNLAYQAHGIDSFAHIFEVRRTNSILLAGFHTLSQALESLHKSIDASLSEFSHSFQELHESYLRVEDSEKRDKYLVDDYLKQLNINVIESRNRLGQAVTELRNISYR